eukprot:TRINITY_DN2574_c0_g1_i1.p1 TRINITY_DN2574_c0_g1~~TRINITY_DN2574_c0_g1_i1.p1  ORF type:complete len:173 (-),score=28.06 TRINITY_DN2574_c0_g1_i1:69-542(-)
MYEALSRVQSLPVRIFNKFDTNKDGSLGTNELRNLCYSLGHYLSDEELLHATTILDTNQDGFISVEEFKYWWNTTRWSSFLDDPAKGEQVTEIAALFASADEDGNGVLDEEEFTRFWETNHLATKLGKSRSECMAEVDSNQSATICFNEFVEWWSKI